MELRQLRYFVAVAQEKSLSKAARKVHIAQPALSRQIQMLEEELEAELLNRTARGVELTPAGQQFTKMAESVLQKIADIKPSIQELRGVPAGEVSIGVSPSLVPFLVKHLLSACAQQYPLINLHLVEGLGMFLAAWLEQSRLELAVYSTLGGTPGADLEEVMPEEIVVVGVPKLLRQWTASIPAVDVVKLPLLLTPAFRARICARLMQDDISLHDVREVDSVATVKEMVSQGDYCSALPYSFVQDDVAKGRLTALHFSGQHVLRKIVVATKAHGTLSPAGRRVAKLVREILQGLPKLES